MKYDRRALRNRRNRAARSGETHTGLTIANAIDSLTSSRSCYDPVTRNFLSDLVNNEGEFASFAHTAMAFEDFLAQDKDWSFTSSDIRGMFGSVLSDEKLDRKIQAIFQTLSLANEPRLFQSSDLKTLAKDLKTVDLESAIGKMFAFPQQIFSIPNRLKLPFFLSLLRSFALAGVSSEKLLARTLDECQRSASHKIAANVLFGLVKKGVTSLAKKPNTKIQLTSVGKFLQELKKFLSRSTESYFVSERYSEIFRLWLVSLLAHFQRIISDLSIQVQISSCLERMCTDEEHAKSLLKEVYAGNRKTLNINENRKVVLNALKMLSEPASLSYPDRLRYEIVKTRSMIEDTKVELIKSKGNRRKVLEQLRTLENLLERGVPAEHKSLAQALHSSFVGLYTSASIDLNLCGINFDDTLKLLKLYPNDSRLAALSVCGALFENQVSKIKFLEQSPARGHFNLDIIDNILSLLEDYSYDKPLIIRSYLFSGFSQDQLRQIYLRRCALKFRLDQDQMSIGERLKKLDGIKDFFDLRTLALNDLNAGADLDGEIIFYIALHGRQSLRLSPARRLQFLQSAMEQIHSHRDAQIISDLLREYPLLWSDASPIGIIQSLTQYAHPLLFERGSLWLSEVLRELRLKNSQSPELLRFREVVFKSKEGSELWSRTDPNFWSDSYQKRQPFLDRLMSYGTNKIPEGRPSL